MSRFTYESSFQAIERAYECTVFGRCKSQTVSHFLPYTYLDSHIDINHSVLVSWPLINSWIFSRVKKRCQKLCAWFETHLQIFINTILRLMPKMHSRMFKLENKRNGCNLDMKYKITTMTIYVTSTCKILLHRHAIAHWLFTL